MKRPNSKAHLDAAIQRLAATKDICLRLFAYRKCHSWPPEIAQGEDWDVQYQGQKYTLPVLPTVDEAVAWANGLIQRIDNAEA